MKISEHWLREFVSPPADTRTMAERLTLAGIEVAGVAEALPPLAHVVVGEVRAVAPHPQADRLTVCEVETGAGRTLQIVCGAPNVRVGLKAPVILPGGRLPDGTEIRASRLRGVESQGMLCSARELALADEQAGLWELPADTAVGAPLAEVLGGQDRVLEVEITPNRGDCLSVLGIARELGALYDLDLRLPDCGPVAAASAESLPARVEAPGVCPVFAGRVIRGLRADAQTPLWLRERLRRAGLRPLHPVVDVTQYVMLELGQPMHAYDLNRLQGGLRVRLARAGETLRLLGGTEVTLDGDFLVIADETAVLGLAGIMGGQSTAVTAGCRDVYLESACFLPEAIQGRARRLGLSTEAGYRFERGVDPSGQVRALERATQLLLAIAGGQAGPVAISVQGSQKPPAARELVLRRERLDRLLGMTVPEGTVVRILRRLGFAPQEQEQGWRVSVPPHRYDIEIEEDLVEEIGRIHGYEHIPASHYPGAFAMQPVPETRLPVSRLREVLIQRGYQEVITYSFVEALLQRRLTAASGLSLANPISADMTEMRCSLWPGLIQVLRYNLNRQQTRVRIFETGMRFILQGTEIQQENTIACLVSGPQYPLQWGLPRRLSDFSDLKGDIEALLAATGAAERLEARAEAHPALHPGQSAKLLLDGLELGWMGTLHPALAREFDIPQPTLLAELRLEPLLTALIPAFQPVSRYPSIQRDLAVVVDEEVRAAELLAEVRQAAGSRLVEAKIFDIYRGKGIDSGRKSVALGLILQDSSRTLTDQEADAVMTQVAKRLRQTLGATIRD